MTSFLFHCLAFFPLRLPALRTQKRTKQLFVFSRHHNCNPFLLLFPPSFTALMPLAMTHLSHHHQHQSYQLQGVNEDNHLGTTNYVLRELSNGGRNKARRRVLGLGFFISFSFSISDQVVDLQPTLSDSGFQLLCENKILLWCAIFGVFSVLFFFHFYSPFQIIDSISYWEDLCNSGRSCEIQVELLIFYWEMYSIWIHVGHLGFRLHSEFGTFDI